MDCCTKKIFYVLLCVCLFWQVRTSPELKSINTHLREFSQHNVTHHDNIDEEIQKYVHKHKHGKNDEEHEHNHDHSKLTDKLSQSEMKALNTACNVVNHSIEIKTKNIFSKKTLISTPHPFGIFRPPISYFIFKAKIYRREYA